MRDEKRRALLNRYAVPMRYTAVKVQRDSEESTIAMKELASRSDSGESYKR